MVLIHLAIGLEADSVNPDQTAPTPTSCPGSTLFASQVNVCLSL